MVSKKLREVIDSTNTQKLLALIAIQEAQKILNTVDACELWFTCSDLRNARIRNVFGTYNINVYNAQDLASLLCKPDVEPEVVYSHEHRAAANLNITVEMWDAARRTNSQYFMRDYNETDGRFYREVTKLDVINTLRNIIRINTENLKYL